MTLRLAFMGTPDFAVPALLAATDRLVAEHNLDLRVLFLDCDDDRLERRYTETRRRHPLAAERPVVDGIRLERHVGGHDTGARPRGLEFHVLGECAVGVVGHDDLLVRERAQHRCGSGTRRRHEGEPLRRGAVIRSP